MVYSSGLGHRPILGVTYVQKEDNTVVFCCYSEDTYFEVTETWDVKAEPQILGIPIIEYPSNEARLGAFEIVLPLLDAINNVQSNRMDGVEQFVQALMLFHNVDISSEDYKNLRAEGAIKFKDIDATLKADVGYLTAELNQTQTQTLTDDMYDTVLTICGMPNRNGGFSTSDTGSAVIMRDGWSSAEARAKDSEQMFKRSEKQFLKIAIKICNNLRALSLKMSALEIRFTRRNYENISEKASVLVAMLNNGKIAPQLAFTHCGMFSDPQLAYKISAEYAEKQEEKELSTGKSLKRDGETTSEKRKTVRREPPKNAGGINMKIDTSRIEGYADMSTEDKLKALEGFEYEDNAAELSRQKNAISKANSDAAQWKRSTTTCFLRTSARSRSKPIALPPCRKSLTS